MAATATFSAVLDQSFRRPGCADILHANVPAGGACIDQSNCVKGRCASVDGSCSRVCSVGDPGQPCNSYSMYPACNPKLGYCKATDPFFGGPGVCVAYGKLGDTGCSSDAPCDPATGFCDSSSTCVPFASVSEQCSAGTHPCDPATSYCDGTTSTCVARGKVGSPCTNDECDATLVCNPDINQCTAPDAEGAYCTWFCANGLVCDGAHRCERPRNPGDTCTFWGECVSPLRCLGLVDSRAIGTCGPARRGGEPCVADGDCEKLVCDGDSKTCADSRLFHAVGSPCFPSNGTCVDSWCKRGSTGGAAGTCTAFGAAGEECDVYQVCAIGMFCSARTLTCQPRAQPGEHCDASSDSCTIGYYCDAKNATCQRQGTSISNCTASVQCVAGMHCDLPSRTCAPPGKAAAACSVDSDCDAAYGYCTSGRCAPWHVEGEACNVSRCDAQTYCDHSNYRCVKRVPEGMSCRASLDACEAGLYCDHDRGFLCRKKAAYGPCLAKKACLSDACTNRECKPVCSY